MKVALFIEAINLAPAASSDACAARNGGMTVTHLHAGAARCAKKLATGYYKVLQIARFTIRCMPLSFDALPSSTTEA